VLKRQADAIGNRDPILALVRTSALVAARPAGTPHMPAHSTIIRGAGGREGIDCIDECRATDARVQLQGAEALNARLRALPPAGAVRSLASAICALYWSSLVGEPTSEVEIDGSAARTILQRPPPVTRSDNEKLLPRVLCISACAEPVLRLLAHRYADALKGSPDSFDDWCFTSAVGRPSFEHRLAVVATNKQAAHSALAAYAADRSDPSVLSASIVSGAHPRLAFVFAGQSAQYARMGMTLYRADHTFRQVLMRCDELLRSRLERPLLSTLEAAAGSPDSKLLDETLYTQPALYALECALCDMWRSWGVRPDAVLGHSVGEFAAAYAAGVFGLEDGLSLIAERARLMHALPAGGAMLTVNAQPAAVSALLARAGSRVAIAAFNAPDETVIAGARAEVAALWTPLAEAGMRAKWLTVSHAFHSPLMAPIVDAFREQAAGIPYRNPSVSLVSTVTGSIVTPASPLDADYWAEHISAPVRFVEGLRKVREMGCDHFLEIGPSATVRVLGRRTLDGGTWHTSLRRDQDDITHVARALGELYVGGVELDWAAFYRPHALRKLTVLPAYPFESLPDGAATAH
jgi:acyl transferase domain-containing protein